MVSTSAPPEPPEPPDPPSTFLSAPLRLCLQPSFTLSLYCSIPSLPSHCRWILVGGAYEIFGNSCLSIWVDTRGRCRFIRVGGGYPCSRKLSIPFLRRPPLVSFSPEFATVAVRGSEFRSSFLLARGRRQIVDLAPPPLSSTLFPGSPSASLILPSFPSSSPHQFLRFRQICQNQVEYF